LCKRIKAAQERHESLYSTKKAGKEKEEFLLSKQDVKDGNQGEMIYINIFSDKVELERLI